MFKRYCLLFFIVFFNASTHAKNDQALDALARYIEAANFQEPSTAAKVFNAKLTQMQTPSWITNAIAYESIERNASFLSVVTFITKSYEIRPYIASIEFEESICISLVELEQKFSVIAKPYEIWPLHGFHTKPTLVGHILYVTHNSGSLITLDARLFRDGGCTNTVTISGGAKK